MNPKTMYLLFSHKLTDEQIADSKESLDIAEFHYLPKELQKLFSSVPPELESLEEYAKPFKEYLNEEASVGDIVLIQGDFGLSYILVNFCKANDLIPVYATTKRVAVEKDGVKISQFKHIRFRRYE